MHENCRRVYNWTIAYMLSWVSKWIVIACDKAINMASPLSSRCLLLLLLLEVSRLDVQMGVISSLVNGVSSYSPEQLTGKSVNVWLPYKTSEPLLSCVFQWANARWNSFNLISFIFFRMCAIHKTQWYKLFIEILSLNHEMNNNESDRWHVRSTATTNNLMISMLKKCNKCNCPSTLKRSHLRHRTYYDLSFWCDSF